jgi:chitinase
MKHIKDKHAIIQGTHLMLSSSADMEQHLVKVIEQAKASKEANSELLMVAFSLRARCFLKELQELLSG